MDTPRTLASNMSFIPSKCFLWITCSFRGTRAVRLEGGILKLCEGEDGTKLKTRERLRVREDRWMAFAKAVSFLEAGSWKGEFDTEDLDMMVFDGCSWGFDYENSGLRCLTGGDNAYPSYDDCATSLDADRALLLFLAMDNLIRKRYLAEFL